MGTRYLESQRKLTENKYAPSEHNFILDPTTKVICKFKKIKITFFLLEKL